MTPTSPLLVRNTDGPKKPNRLIWPLSDRASPWFLKTRLNLSMTVPPNGNRGELHRIILRAHLGRGEQEAKDLRISFGGPASQKIQEKENQDTTEQAVEEIEGGSAQTHGKEEQLSFGPGNGERPGKRSMHSVHSANVCHAILRSRDEELSFPERAR